MPKMIDTEGAIRYIKSKAEVADMIEAIRLSMKSTKTEFAARLGITPEHYNHLTKGKVYPSFKVLALLSQSGVDIRSMTDLSHEDRVSIIETAAAGEETINSKRKG